MYDGPIPQRVLYTIRQPRSAILAQECTRSWARTQVERGAFPRQSIWYPGCCEGATARPDIGDLFGPDPTWKHARPLHAVSDDHFPEQTR